MAKSNSTASSLCVRWDDSLPPGIPRPVGNSMGSCHTRHPCPYWLAALVAKASGVRELQNASLTNLKPSTHKGGYWRVGDMAADHAVW